MIRAVVVLAGIVPSVPALSCIRDSDTIAMERARFPSTLELITGKFARHSREFYEWRIRDRERRIAAEPGNIHSGRGVWTMVAWVMAAALVGWGILYRRRRARLKASQA